MHGGQIFARPMQRVDARTRHLERTLGAPAALGRWLRHGGTHQALRGEAIERCVDRADRHIAAGAFRNLPPHAHAVGVAAQTQHREQHQVLELAQ
jgi:hypothetical protein